MRQLFLGLASFIIIISGSLVHPSIIHADLQSDIIQRVDADIKILNEFIDKTDTTTDTDLLLALFDSELATVQSHLRQSSEFYLSSANSETDNNIKAILGKLNTQVKGLSSSLSLMKTAIDSGDESEYDTALENYNQYINELNTSVQELNSAYGTTDYSWLAWPFWISLILSVVLFIMSRGSPVSPAEQLRNQFEFALFKSSLWPLVGSAVTYYWYLSTPPGGTFYVFYGLIGVGFFQFFRGLNTYINEARPAIELAKTEEKSRLETLIRSERFQKESVEEKAKG